MSLWLYRTRLFWNGVTGSAKDRGKVVVLTAAPVLPGLVGERILFIDWAPYYYGEILRLHGPRREMNGEEIAAARAFLLEMVP